MNVHITMHMFLVSNYIFLCRQYQYFINQEDKYVKTILPFNKIQEIHLKDNNKKSFM